MLIGVRNVRLRGLQKLEKGTFTVIVRKLLLIMRILFIRRTCIISIYVVDLFIGCV